LGCSRQTFEQQKQQKQKQQQKHSSRPRTGQQERKRPRHASAGLQEACSWQAGDSIAAAACSLLWLLVLLGLLLSYA